jgi:hypothetical protein
MGGGGFHSYGYDDGDGGVDRRNWNDKSSAAIRRENQAKGLFDKFLEDAKKQSVFPITQDVIPPNVHLTDACWKTFKKLVTDRGCTVKRRVATNAEREALLSKDRRNSKMYVISVTISVHPAQAAEARQAREAKAKETADKRAEKGRLAEEKRKAEAERKAKEESELKTKIEQEYAAVVASLADSNKESNKPAALQDRSNKKRDDENSKTDVKEPAKKRQKTRITVPRERILQHAENVHRQQVSEIKRKIYEEKIQESQRLNEQMTTKEEALLKEAKEYSDRIKESITA